MIPDLFLIILTLGALTHGDQVICHGKYSSCETICIMSSVTLQELFVKARGV